MGLVAHMDAESGTRVAGVSRVTSPCRNFNRGTGRKCDQPVALVSVGGELRYAFPPDWKAMDGAKDNAEMVKLWGAPHAQEGGV